MGREYFLSFKAGVLKIVFEAWTTLYFRGTGAAWSIDFKGWLVKSEWLMMTLASGLSNHLDLVVTKQATNCHYILIGALQLRPSYFKLVKRKLRSKEIQTFLM